MRMTTRQDLSSTIHETALLGTRRKSFTMPQVEGALGSLLSQLVESDRRAEANEEAKNAEKLLLEVAAVVSLYEACGQMPERISTDLPSVCESDASPVCPPRTSQFFAQMLEGQHADVLPEALRLAAVKGFRIFADLLPALLELGTKHTDLRDAITPVLGERGQWLARQNPAWEWAEAPNTVEESAVEEVWQTASRDKRMTLLRELRRTEPSRSRALLASTWEQEAPEDRSAFLRLFENNLGEADEALLEVALDDRRKEVRRVAFDLLTRLPSSALVRRMKERVRSLVEISSVRMSKRKNPLAATLPAECDRAMQRDGIKPKPPHGIGEKAWWLMQMLGAVPPAVWCEHLKLGAPELLELAKTHKFSDALLGGWAIATTRFRDTGWAEAFWSARTPLPQNQYGVSPSIVEAVLAVLPSSRCEELLISELESNPVALDDSVLTLAFLEQFHHPWSVRLTRIFWNKLRHKFTDKLSLTGAEWVILRAAREAAVFMAPSIGEEVARGWATDERLQDRARQFEQTFSLLSFRHNLQKSFEEES
ncbi:MAG: DUF5691 domain-containing protein [Pyrinomonadaceae bacterium MAG19_C2-C3]|nr:DUF5691 domain-containing protein [Pyrinomonadaceae bacterium MAG19_C2-C3]